MKTVEFEISPTLIGVLAAIAVSVASGAISLHYGYKLWKEQKKEEKLTQGDIDALISEALKHRIAVREEDIRKVIYKFKEAEEAEERGEPPESALKAEAEIPWSIILALALAFVISEELI